MSPKPRVLIFMDTIAVGGPGKGLLQFLRQGADAVCEPTIAACEVPSGKRWLFGEAVRTTGFPLEILRQTMTYDPMLIPRAFDLVKRSKADIIQSHGYKGNCICLALRILTGKPWISFVHGWTAENAKMKLYNVMDKLVLRQADWIVPVSESMIDRLDLRASDRKRVIVIRNAVAPGEHEPVVGPSEVRARYGIPADSTLIGVIGRFSPEKGHIYFVEAMVDVVREHPKAVAMLVGDGQERGALERRVEELGLRDRVVFTGFQEQLAPFYSAFDLVVMPSLSEGMPNVALEAMLHGKPVVATRVGGVPEVVVEGVTGVLSGPSDPGGLAGRILHVVSNPELIYSLGQAGRQRVLSEFDPRQRVERIGALYRQALGQD